MLRIKPIALVAALTFLFSDMTANAQLQHYTLNGDFAKAYWSWGFATHDIYVARTKSGNTVNTYMQFDLWYSQTYVVSGYGTIPNSTFTGNPGNGFTLDMDISSLQAQTYACDYTFYPYYYNCYPITLAGRLQVHWDKTHQEIQSYTFMYKSQLPGRHVNEKGSEDSTSASASGNMLGVGLSNGIGWIGKTHNVDIDVQKKSK